MLSNWMSKGRKKKYYGSFLVYFLKMEMIAMKRSQSRVGGENQEFGFRSEVA